MSEEDRPLQQLAEIEEHLQHHPDEVEFLLRKGAILRKLERDEEALTVYESLLFHNFALVPAYYGLSHALMKLGRQLEALPIVVMGLVLDPQFTENWLVLGYIFEDLHRYSNALESFHTVITQETTNGKGWFHLGYVLSKMRQYPEAIKAFEQSIALHAPQVGSAWANISTIYELLGDHDQAVVAAQNGYEAQPLDPFARLVYADTLVDMGKFAEAKVLYVALVQEDPTNVMFLANYGILLSKMHRWEESRDMLTQALAMNKPTEPEYQEYAGIISGNLARAYFAMGDFAQSLLACSNKLDTN